MNKRLHLIILLSIVIFAAIILMACNQKDDITYANTREAFCSKINTDSVIYVDDIDFGTETESTQIKIEKSVSIIGKSDKSVLKNIYFFVSGGALEAEMITVSFQNVIFDGNCNNEDLVIDSTKSYVKNMVSKRDEKRAIHAEGFITLNIDNCDFTDYNSFGGAAVYANYTDGNKDLCKRISISMSNCNVYNNYSFRGAIHFNCVKPISATFTGCNFYDNRAAYASCIFAGGVTTTIDSCSFRRNVYQEVTDVYATNYVTKEKTNYVSGQAIYFTDAEGTVTNCTFENNIGYTGGAIGSNKSTLTVDSCEFLRNTAKNNGGAISVFSKETMPTFVTNSVFIGNNANNQGNVFYNLNSDSVYRRTKACFVEFSLCTFAENNGNDNSLFYNDTSTYKYMEGKEWRDESVTPFVYNIEKDDSGRYLYNSDNVEDKVLGSFVIDKSYVAKENSYTQAYTLEQAIALHAINQADFSKVDTVKIKKGSVADIIIPTEIAATYANGKYKDNKSTIKLGANDYVASKGMAWLWWTMGSLGLAACIAFALSLVLRRRKVLSLAIKPTTEVESKATANTEIATTANTDEATLRETVDKIISEFKLSQRECEVLIGLLEGKIAKQIAGELFISFDTARFHIKNLYRKLGVHSQAELKVFCQNCRK